MPITGFINKLIAIKADQAIVSLKQTYLVISSHNHILLLSSCPELIESRGLHPLVALQGSSEGSSMSFGLIINITNMNIVNKKRILID